jgi:hypothetical protein
MNLNPAITGMAERVQLPREQRTCKAAGVKKGPLG